MVEFQVLRCAKCTIFQVMQVTKSSKWKCKLCGEKQSFIKCYGRGSGADCRRHVQKLNTLQGQIDETKEDICLVPPHSFPDIVNSNDNHNKDDTSSDYMPLKKSRWSHFLEHNIQNEDESHFESRVSMHCSEAGPDLDSPNSHVTNFYKRNERKRLLMSDGSPENSPNTCHVVSGINSFKAQDSPQRKCHNGNLHPKSSISQTQLAKSRTPGSHLANSAVISTTTVKPHKSQLSKTGSSIAICFNSSRTMTRQGLSPKGHSDHGEYPLSGADSCRVRSNELRGQEDELKCVIPQATCNENSIAKQKKQKKVTEKLSKKWSAYIESDSSEDEDDDDDEDDFGIAYKGDVYPMAPISISDLKSCGTKLPGGEKSHANISTETFLHHGNRAHSEDVQHYKPGKDLTSSVNHQENDNASDRVVFDLGYDSDSLGF